MKNLGRVLSGLFVAFLTFIVLSQVIDPKIVLGLFAFGFVISLFAKKENGILAITTFYTPSDLVTGQAKLIEKFLTAAKKEIEPVTYLAFRRNNDISNPNFADLRTREDRPLAAYFLMRTARALGTGRSYNATGATGTSNTLVPSYITYNDTFSLSMKLMGDNIFSWAEAYANELENLFKNFSKGNESNATSFLVNNRSSYNVAVAEGSFNGTTKVFELTESAVGNRALQITDSMMAENLWGGYPLTIFCDTISYNKFAFMNNQPVGTYQNLSFQVPGKTYVRSLDLTATAISLGYTKGFWFAVPDGTIAALDWIPTENRTVTDKPPYKWFPIINPYDSTTYAGYEWYIGTDTFTNSVTQDLQLNYQVSLDIAFEAAPLSNSGETPIQAVAMV